MKKLTLFLALFFITAAHAGKKNITSKASNKNRGHKDMHNTFKACEDYHNKQAEKLCKKLAFPGHVLQQEQRNPIDLIFPVIAMAQANHRARNR